MFTKMLYGYVAAAIAGFLLTAIPNWTGGYRSTAGRSPALAALWLAGRLALLISAQLGGLVAAIVDTALPCHVWRRLPRARSSPAKTGEISACW
jgi:uncharacterized protein involved in response to NO